MISNSDLIAQFERHKKQSEQGLARQWREIQEGQQLYAGNPQTFRNSASKERGKTMVNFNRVKPFINAVAGFMVQLRREPEYSARHFENDIQQAMSDYANGVSRYFRSEANAHHFETQKDIQQLIGGVGLIDTQQSYAENPYGEIAMEAVNPLHAGWDPYATQTNLLDSRWMYRHKEYDVDEAMEMFDAEATDFETTQGDGEDNAQYHPLGGSYNKIGMDYLPNNEERVRVYQYHWYEMDDFYRANNPIPLLKEYSPDAAAYLLDRLQATKGMYKDDDVTLDYFRMNAESDILVADGALKTEVDEIFGTYGLEMDWDTDKRKCYYTALLSGKKVFDSFKSIYQQGYTMLAQTADRDERENCWFGLVRGLKDPSNYSNKALTELIYTIAHNAKGGYFLEEGATDNPAAFERDVAKSDKVVHLNDGGLQKVLSKAQNKPVTGYEDIISYSDDSMYDVTGVRKEFLASSENKQVSAVLERQRVKQVVTTLALYFDAISLYQKEHAKLMLAYVRSFMKAAPGRAIRIAGDNGVEMYQQLSEDMLADEYDIIISEAPQTATEKEEAANTMMLLASSLMPMGVNIYPVAIRYLEGKGISRKDIQELSKMLQPQPPNPEQQALAQEASALETERKKAELQKILAEISKKEAETQSEIQDTLQTEIENTLALANPDQEVNITL